MQDHPYVFGPRHGDIEQALIDAVVAALDRRGQLLGPRQEHDADRQAACSMPAQDPHRLVAQRARRLVTGPQPNGPTTAGRSHHPASICRLSLCTVPVPSPVNFAVFMMPVPLASSWRAQSSLSASAPGLPNLFRTLPALLTNLPSRSILALMTLRPALTRWRIIERSNSAKAPGIWNSSLPAGVVVSIDCWSR